MADVTTGNAGVSPINKGLLQDETIANSAVAKLAGLRTLDGKGHIYHVIEDTQGVYVPEGGVKPDTGVSISELRVDAVKFIKKFTYSDEALNANPSLITQLVDSQAKSLAHTYDQAVLGLVSTGTANFDNFANLTNEVVFNTASDLWEAHGIASAKGDVEILLTGKMLSKLRGVYNNLSQRTFDIQGDSNEGTIEGIKYAVVKGVAETFGIMGPFSSRAVSALGNPRSDTNDRAMEYWETNTTGALAEIYGGFKVVDKNDFVKFTVDSTVNPDPDPVTDYTGTMNIENYGNVDFTFNVNNGALSVGPFNEGTNGTISLLGDYLDSNNDSYTVNENASIVDQYVNIVLLPPTSGSITSWDVVGTYTPDAGGGSFDFNGYTPLTLDADMWDGVTTFDSETGILNITGPIEVAGLTVTLNGTYDVDGEQTYDIANFENTGIFDMEGGCNFTIQPFSGAILSWNVTGTLSN